MSLKQKIKWKTVNNYRVFYVIKKNCLVCMYKMVDISKETCENNDIEVIVDGIGTLWLNEKHIEEKLGHKNLPVITNKYDPVYKKHRMN